MYQECLTLVFFQRKTANVFLAGPPLVKMATNEISSNAKNLEVLKCTQKFQVSPII